MTRSASPGRNIAGIRALRDLAELSAMHAEQPLSAALSDIETLRVGISDLRTRLDGCGRTHADPDATGQMPDFEVALAASESRRAEALRKEIAQRTVELAAREAALPPLRDAAGRARARALLVDRLCREAVARTTRTGPDR